MLETRRASAREAARKEVGPCVRRDQGPRTSAGGRSLRRRELGAGGRDLRPRLRRPRPLKPRGGAGPASRQASRRGLPPSLPRPAGYGGGPDSRRGQGGGPPESPRHPPGGSERHRPHGQASGLHRDRNEPRRGREDRRRLGQLRRLAHDAAAGGDPLAGDLLLMRHPTHIQPSAWKGNSRKLRSRKYAGEVHGRTILNLASRSTLTPSLSPKSTISSVVLFLIMPPKLNVLEPVPVGAGFKVKRTASPNKGMPR